MLHGLLMGAERSGLRCSRKVAPFTAGRLMSIEIVNGYVCRDCTDVERAKKGEDPAEKPNASPKPGSSEDQPRGVNRPLADGERGTRVNLLL
jgi:hypothetical protein